MSRYIDADDITKRIQSRIGYFEMYYPNDTKNIYELQNCLEIVNEIPTADVKPIVYGEWIYREELFDDEEKPRMVWGCKKCGFNLKSIHDKRNFCPNCGATMKNESEEEK